MHVAWRWVTGLGFDQEIPHHSTFSKNRHGRFQESKLFEQLFEQIVKQCVEVGLVRGKELSVDGSFVEANAAKQSRMQWLADRHITPYMRTRDSIHRKRSPFFGPERFTYEPEHNRYICPAGQPLNYGGRVYRNRAFNYIGTRKKCGPCSLRPQCTSAAFRGLIIHQNEPARQRARELVNTPEFAKAQRQRKKVEALFAELKNQIGLRRLRLRRLRFVREQFFLAAVAQNIKRLVRFLSQPTAPVLPTTT